MGKGSIKYSLKKWKYAYSIFSSHFERTILIISSILEIAAGIASVGCLICLTVYVGYELDATERKLIYRLINISMGIFCLSFLYDTVFRFRTMVKQSRIIKWIVDAGLVLSAIASITSEPQNPWIPWLSTLIYSKKFMLAALGAYSLVNICYTLSRIPSRRTNPSLLMASSFIFFIIIGSLALMLPRCTYDGISYFDSLFISSSAVCITGLTSLDIPATFTPLGLLVISILIQLGSLGIITFTSFFAMFFTGNTSIYNQLLLKDMIYSKSMNSLVPTLLYVLGFTVAVEAIGAVCVFLTVPDSLGMAFHDKVVFSAFHSMSAFCNAGFSCLPGGMSNVALMQSNQNIYIVTSFLIFAGAIGFPILVNMKEIMSFYLHKAWHKLRGKKVKALRVHIFDLNTKLVLYTTLSILAVSSIAFFIFEYHNTLDGMSTYKKVVQSIFNSLVPRSAGFASVNPSNFLSVTLLLIVVQMIIGGSSQSMAGGIKVNTFGTAILNLRAVLFGHSGTTAFNRTINMASVRRANAIIILSVLASIAYLTVMLLLEPGFSAKDICFETISALFTVGSSLGITPELSNASKIVLCTAMFFGRVGLLSLLAGILGSTRDLSPHLPTDNVIIN